MNQIPKPPDDLIAGEQGRDTLEGESGDDLLLGGAGDDSLSGESGDDAILGCTGTDAVDGGEGNDSRVGVETRPRSFVPVAVSKTAVDVAAVLPGLFVGPFRNGMSTGSPVIFSPPMPTLAPMK